MATNNSISSSSAPSGGAATAPPSAQIHAFIIPPPMTYFVQFSDGLQLAFTPSPLHFLQSGGRFVPFANFFGNGSTDAAGGDAMLRALHDFFMRAQSEQHGPPPTSKSFLEKLPQQMWTPAMKETAKQAECVICLCDYEANDMVISLPCNHVFHKDCGMPWLKEHNVCPTCRYQLPTQEEAVKPEQEEPTTNAPPAPEPESEPATSTTEDEASRTTGVRRPRVPSETQERVVRQRVDNTHTSSRLPSTSSTTTQDDVDVELERMLEEEANNLVKEQQDDEVNFDNDADLEALLHDTSN